MIQRKQSLHLLAIVICNALLLAIPFGTNAATGNDLMAQNNTFTLILAVATMLISVYTALQFKDRKKQLKLVKMIMALIIAFFVAGHMAVHGSLFSFSMDAMTSTIKIGMIFPVLSLAFAFLANKGIKKDEELVKSVDRLR